MNLILLKAHIQYFLLNREGISDEQITAICSSSTLASEIFNLITDVSSELKKAGQKVDEIEQNEKLLIEIFQSQEKVKHV